MNAYLPINTDTHIIYLDDDDRDDVDEVSDDV